MAQTLTYLHTHPHIFELHSKVKVSLKAKHEPKVTLKPT